ncbi:FHA domain-containing protein [Microbulbifer yueqingensis]|uniref:FHA domain protein n=1 Tax=Microbulbifer yueqingensis TaxID=658219 RepID=A0A1G8XXB6_9GAMM|nr:FHA domain-containing protein [Microbulbifer yueqingensis]SDJ95141.1 FHA domain protein [Microbulbifer yueqingensis]
MALIIEELNRARHVQARYRMDGGRLTLGRGYGNDVIIEDVHADPSHAEIVCDEDGSYYLRDLDSENGTQLVRNLYDSSIKSEEVQRRAIESGDEIQVGRTHLRLCHSESAVPPAVPLHSLEGILERLSHPSRAIGLLVAVAGLTLFFTYLNYAGKLQWTEVVNLAIGSLVGLLVYAAAWAFIGRVVRHDTRFFAHLSIAALGALAYTSWEWLRGLLDFNFAIGESMPLINFAVLAVILPAMLWCACYLALNISRGWRWAISLLLPLAFLGLGLAEDIASMAEFSDVPQISTTLKHEDFLLRQPMPMEEFLRESSNLYDIEIKQDEAEGATETATPAAADDEPQGRVQQHDAGEQA